MDVIFRRTGARQYAVIVRVAGAPVQTMHPAPGFDEHLPHDLIHYVVEAELKLTAGVFGRAASGGGTFYSAEQAATPRERARQRRKQGRRELALCRTDDSNDRELAMSERLAFLCDLAWRRRQGQRPDPARWHQPSVVSADDAERIARVVQRLDQLAPVWNAVPIDGELAFGWPGLTPR